MLDPHDAGYYASGLVLTKAMLFLPQFVVIVLFPAMARSNGGRRTHLLGLGSILGIGVVAALVVSGLSGSALVFVGGDAYAPIQSSLWLFAALGTVLAMIQLLVYSALAQRHPRAVISLWVALAVTVVLAPLADTAHQLLLIKLGVDLVLLVVLAVHLLVLTPLAAPNAPAPAEPVRPAWPRTRRRPSSPRCAEGPRPQCAASCQDRPTPTLTSSGTSISMAPPISWRTSASTSVALARRDLEHQLVVHLEQHARLRAGLGAAPRRPAASRA